MWCTSQQRYIGRHWRLLAVCGPQRRPRERCRRDIHTYIHTYIHTHARTHVHTCMHTYTAGLRSDAVVADPAAIDYAIGKNGHARNGGSMGTSSEKATVTVDDVDDEEHEDPAMADVVESEAHTVSACTHPLGMCPVYRDGRSRGIRGSHSQCMHPPTWHVSSVPRWQKSWNQRLTQSVHAPSHLACVQCTHGSHLHAL